MRERGAGSEKDVKEGKGCFGKGGGWKGEEGRGERGA